MFTGLVSAVGVVHALERSASGARLVVGAPLAAELEPGDSVAVSGVCLTAVERGDDRVTVEAVPETLERSSLGELSPGDPVNLELPLRASDRLGGHIVQGHVDGVGRVESTSDEGRSRRLLLGADGAVCRYIVHKGSVALDGVSLTAIEPGEEGFSVALIPETLERTTLGELAPGDRVNIEVDVLAKYVERLTAPEVALAGGR